MTPTASAPELQISFADTSEEYKAFLDKFKPKKTTDDCYTPDNIYAAVLDWVVNEYGVDRSKVIRPFWPGGDYERADYSGGSVVVDTPPFSILAEIIRFYQKHGVPFFLFAPYLTNFTAANKGDITHVICPVGIIYENGAEIPTSFVTNLDKRYLLRGVPDLFKILKEVDKVNRKEMKKEMPKYQYPYELITAAALGYMTTHGVEFKVEKGEGQFVRKLEAQAAKGKAIFGGGFLLSEKATAERAAAERAAAERAAAERAAAEVWELSERERLVVKSLGKGEKR